MRSEVPTVRGSGVGQASSTGALPAAVLALGCVACLLLGGCYERVIRARGPGAERIGVSEPYQENYPIDDWLFGKPEPLKQP